MGVAAHIRGLIHFEASGVYILKVESNDGVRVHVGDIEIWTDPEIHGPYGAPDSALYHRLPCSFCERRLDSVKACLLEISPTAIAERALSLL